MAFIRECCGFLCFSVLITTCNINIRNILHKLTFKYQVFIMNTRIDFLNKQTAP